MSWRKTRAYANIRILCVGFYPDAGAGPSSSFQPGTKHSLNTLTNLPRNICWFTFICYAGFVSSTFVPDNEGVTLDELDSLTPDSPGAHGDPDVLGYSQLGGAPLGISQQQTPQPFLRPERQVRSPDRHTYSEGHVRAQQRAKRVRRPRGG